MTNTSRNVVNYSAVFIAAVVFSRR